MRNRLLAKGNDFLEDFKFHKSWKRVAAALSAVVIVGTISYLTLPGITLTAPACGLEEHTHTVDCYLAQEGKVPVCTDERLGWYTHTHNELCYGAESSLVCKLGEIRVHTHGPECYVTEEIVVDRGHKHGDSCYRWTVGENLICATEVTEGHTHIESCFVDEKVLSCTLAETEGHKHDESCHSLAKELSCTLAETAAHIHGEGCSDLEGNLICTQVETEGHSHTDSCYTDVDKLICGKEEAEAHTHTERCYTTEKKTVCELEEKPAHAHTEECYEKIKGELTCTETEREKVTEQSQPKLVCGHSELALHTHTETCYTDGALTCPLPEVKEHIHTEECLADRNTVLVCGLDEHTHTDECTPDITAEQQEHIDYVNTLISRLPNVETVETERRSFADNADKLDNYNKILYININTVLQQYAAIAEEHKNSVTETAKLEALKALVPAEFYESTESDIHIVGIYTDNTFKKPMLIDRLVTVQGALPEGATVKAFPAETDFFDVNTIIAYDISVFRADGTEYQPEQPLNVKFEAIADTIENDRYLSVYHIDESNTINKYDVTVTEDDVVFTTDHFSVYALVDEYPLYTMAEQGDSEAVRKLVESGFFEYWAQFLEEEEKPVVKYPLRLTAPVMATPFSMEQTNRQILSGGDEAESWVRNDEDQVSISKFISPTETENVFDITLQVSTSSNLTEMYQKPNISVVIVMDISNTMNSEFPANSGKTRYAAAVEAANVFMKSFAEKTSATSEVGFVAFNTHGHKVFDLSTCNSGNDADKLTATVTSKTQYITDPTYRDSDGADYGSSHDRFTNMEAGLKMAYDMLKNDPNTMNEKYIIFLSDGFPTTYLKNGTTYEGYDPYTGSGTIGNNGTFYDSVWKRYCTYGTSYSDKAAIRARQMATSIKNDNTKIFSIGVDVAGQTISGYLTEKQQYQYTEKDGTITWLKDSNGNRLPKIFSVVDRTGTTYELGSPSSTDSFKNWLGEKIGSNTPNDGDSTNDIYYYDSTNTSELLAAYEKIFSDILKISESTNINKWVAADPLPMDSGTSTFIEFLGFYDKQNEFVIREPGQDVLTLTGAVATADDPGENSARYDESTNSIYWDLKNSRSWDTTAGDTTFYHYLLKYRVRLENEYYGNDKVFTEYDGNKIGVHPTNGNASLSYQVIKQINDEYEVSEIKTLVYPIPTVQGYLGEFTFQKVNEDSMPLKGAEFTMHHNTDVCTTCRGDGKNSVVIRDRTIRTDENGMITFDGIPSGHIYTMTETKFPLAYFGDGRTYTVEVAYDVVTVTETIPGEAPSIWNLTDNIMEKVVNFTGYELPETGGRGTAKYIMGGMAMMIVSAFTLIYRKRFRKKGVDF